MGSVINREEVLKKAIRVSEFDEGGWERLLRAVPVDEIEQLQDISDEEFKAEAKRRGYRLTKITPYVSLLPCVCGNDTINCWVRNDHNLYYSCPSCGLASEDGKSIRGAKINWNKLIDKRIEEKMKCESK
jgi:hypothetical protein